MFVCLYPLFQSSRSTIEISTIYLMRERPQPLPPGTSPCTFILSTDSGPQRIPHLTRFRIWGWIFGSSHSWLSIRRLLVCLSSPGPSIHCQSNEQSMTRANFSQVITLILRFSNHACIVRICFGSFNPCKVPKCRIEHNFTIPNVINHHGLNCLEHLCHSMPSAVPSLLDYGNFDDIFIWGMTTASSSRNMSSTSISLTDSGSQQMKQRWIVGNSTYCVLTRRMCICFSSLGRPFI